MQLNLKNALQLNYNPNSSKKKENKQNLNPKVKIIKQLKLKISHHR